MKTPEALMETIEGADTMIDKALATKGIENGDHGFRLIFSAEEFPRYDVKFTWLRARTSSASTCSGKRSRWGVRTGRR